jgi:ribonuclease-3
MVMTQKAIKNKNYREKYTAFLESLRIDFTSIEPYILAFIHRSVVNERPDFAPEHNERLEFLGDAVLELVVTKELFMDFPEKSEGELTDIRSAIVR